MSGRCRAAAASLCGWAAPEAPGGGTAPEAPGGGAAPGAAAAGARRWRGHAVRCWRRRSPA
eukprot:6343399-Pyramimonas_sp.AAC.1